MKWIWVRHGETDYNRARKYLGHTDVPLNANGREQARQVAELIQSESITRCYTSDLMRCMETARIISQSTRIAPIPVQALRESDFGAWEGKTYEEIMGLAPELASSWYQNPFEVSPPGGETLSAVGKRLDDWLRKEQQSFQPEETILFVSHGGPVRWFQSKWVSEDEKQFWNVKGLLPGQAYAAVWSDNGRWIEGMNDHAAHTAQTRRNELESGKKNPGTARYSAE
ncbi:histidine phosphatase family protein [Brevibacillus ginsengisoli]|uniref:histidine phosphatase family protein n=1 Tax=Brevibacillus ginsengisoli TaxID=363854 RepID=UPI003CEA9943